MSFQEKVLFDFKLTHHHFGGDMFVLGDDLDEPKLLIIKINNENITYYINKIEKINKYDKKIFINNYIVSDNFPQNELNILNTLNMLNMPTVFYLKYDDNLKVWYLKNMNFTTVFLLK